MDSKTPWFNAFYVKPARKGWYEVKCKHGVFGGSSPEHNGERLRWNGLEWRLYGQACSFGRHCDTWRGLAAPQ